MLIVGRTAPALVQRPSPPVPSSPGSSSPPGPRIDTLTPTLQWSAVPNADYYALGISVAPYGSGNLVYNPQRVSGTSLTVPSGVLEPGKQYRWNMQAYNSAGWSELSSILYFQTAPTPLQKPSAPVSLGEAVDNTALSWTTGGNAEWFGQNSIYYHGGDATQSGAISHNQETWIQTTISGPGNLSFYWKVSSEAGYDYLEFYIDGVREDRISGNGDWHQKSYSVTSGSHTLRWRYTKDGSVDRGSDSGWVDKVEFAKEEVKQPVTPVSATIDSYSPSSKIEVDPGQPFTLRVTFANTGTTAWDFLAGVSVWDANWKLVIDEWSSTIRVQPGQRGSYSWTKSISTPGDYWVQFGVWKDESTLLDKAPSPSQNLIKVKPVTPVSTTSPPSEKPQPETETGKIREEIDNKLKYLATTEYKYLFDTDSVMSTIATTFMYMTSPIRGNLVERYYEFYYAALDYRTMAFTAVAKAKMFLNKGDIVNARKYVVEADRYMHLAESSYRGSIAIFQGDVESAAQLARGVYEGSKASVKYGTVFLGPGASKVADGLFLATDFAIDSSELKLTEASKNALSKALVTAIFDYVKIKPLNDKTLSQILTKSTTKVIGDSRLYATLDDILKNPEFEKALMSVLSKSAAFGVKELTKQQTMKLVKAIEESMESIVPVPATGVIGQEKVPRSEKVMPQEEPQSTVERIQSFFGNLIERIQSFFGKYQDDRTTTSPPRITTASLPPATGGVAYNCPLQASGGRPPYSFSLVSGSLPPGLSLSRDGRISGTPNLVGTFKFAVQVRDSSTPARTAQEPLSIKVDIPVASEWHWPLRNPRVIQNFGNRTRHHAGIDIANSGEEDRVTRRKIVMALDKVVAKEQLTELLRRTISFVITLVVLGIIRAVIVELPAMDEPVSDFLTIADIAAAVISVVVIVVVLLFGQDISGRTARMLPFFPEIAPLINNLAILVAIVIAYGAFDTIIMPFLEEIDIVWLYPVVLLCLAILPVYRLTAILFTSSGKITDLVLGKEPTAATTITIACPHCASQVAPAKFCSHCGGELPAQAVGSQKLCPRCGAGLKPEAKFCTHCGSKIEMNEE
ncbi:putative Ig domain-containing protein [Candidatus Hakubella thermalkaliphila]|uniref:Fibronectin type-III domain-containing protein n=2 Tax=Candidatus Hakubella thermalkaliphila TaxID=2754717 RepID=A0A6V8PG06_9ACTN|nr:putative Ig domain-containing protein [Candidatus Hakubella thermalkaliphila]GFP29816.1 hypothetical protein HKBW3S34_00737 [Candidatus Hakubella thermalkaliphila]